MHCSLSSLSRDERRLRSIKIENNALFFVKGHALFFVRDDRRLRSKKRKQYTVLCQGRSIKEETMHCSLSREERRLRSIKRENSALFFVKEQEDTEVNKKRKRCAVLCLGRSIKSGNNALFFVKGGEETEVNKKRK